MCSNKRVCTSIKVCVQSPTSMSLFVCNTLAIDRVSASVGRVSLSEQWQSPAVCARQCSRGQPGVEVPFYVKQ